MNKPSLEDPRWLLMHEDKKAQLVEFFTGNDKRQVVVQGRHSEGREYGYIGPALWETPPETLPWFPDEDIGAARRMISQRTVAGLAAAKARGRKLGSSVGKLAARNAAAAAARDAVLEPILKELSHLSTRAAAAEIERRGLSKLSYKTIARARVRLGLV